MDNFPQFLRPQDPAKTEEDWTKMKNKLDKVRKKLYIYPGTFLSLTSIKTEVLTPSKYISGIAMGETVILVGVVSG